METPPYGFPPPYGFRFMYPPLSPRLASPPSAAANVSPLVIALIGILASAFLLVSYYTVIAKYCTNWEQFRQRVGGGRENESHRQQAPPIEAWALVTRGLEESVIKSIPVFKYKRGDGLVEDTECAVCLSEFQEDESLRLLPKCTHAFHLPCIDMWLSSHSNCPLCRANIVSPAANPSVEAAITVSGENTESTAESPLQTRLESDAERENPPHEESEQGMVFQAPAVPKASHLRALSDSAAKHARNGSLSQSRKPLFPAGMQQPIRRSFSMDSSRRPCVSITDLLAMHPGLQDDKSKGFPNGDEAGSSASSSFRPSPAATEHQLGVEMSSKVLNKHLTVDKNKSTMRRTFSGGKFFFFKNSRGRNAPILPT